ncbi:MAG: DUF5667 domain-containing protein [Thermoleophilia bacterium]|jgi:hypothetical protein
MSAQLENILDDCLESLLAGRDTIDSCCLRYPQLEAELRPLLDVALMSREALKTGMPEAGSAAVREKVMARAHLSASTAKRPLRSRLFGRQIFLRPVALGAGLVFLLSAGTSLAATSADPDSILYPLEQRLENAHTALTPQKLDKAQVEIAHANERLDETERMATAGKPEYIPELLTKFDTHVDSATGLAKEAVDEGEDAGQIEEMILSARERLDKVVADLNGRIPDELRDSVREMVDESDRDNHGQETESSSGNYGSDYTAGIPGGSNGDTETHNGESSGSGENHDSGSGGGSSGPSHQDSPSSDPPHEDPPHEDPPHEDPPHQETPQPETQKSGGHISDMQ